ncbi:hypothetical protein TcWFU_002391 [Taenia crassiceps]|uniref:Uncharacterized protein n=1 Tax=Taenia crassiceps TaxID=6207 RepID=A0ABR4QGL3_9CEST
MHRFGIFHLRRKLQWHRKLVFFGIVLFLATVLTIREFFAQDHLLDIRYREIALHKDGINSSFGRNPRIFHFKSDSKNENKRSSGRYPSKLLLLPCHHQ